VAVMQIPSERIVWATDSCNAEHGYIQTPPPLVQRQ
jgi:hypothetical protein